MISGWMMDKFIVNRAMANGWLVVKNDGYRFLVHDGQWSAKCWLNGWLMVGYWLVNCL